MTFFFVIFGYGDQIVLLSLWWWFFVFTVIFYPCLLFDIKKKKKMEFVSVSLMWTITIISTSTTSKNHMPHQIWILLLIFIIGVFQIATSYTFLSSTVFCPRSSHWPFMEFNSHFYRLKTDRIKDRAHNFILLLRTIATINLYAFRLIGTVE